MITAMPVFIVKNLFRDTLAGFAAGRYPQVLFGGTLAGGAHAVRDLATGRSEPMREYLLQGGFLVGAGGVRTPPRRHPRRGWTRPQGVAAGRRWSRLVYILTRPAWVAEAGTRVNQFMRARRAGATNYAAARAARMVSSDFANIGASRGWRMYVHTARLSGQARAWPPCRALYGRSTDPPEHGNGPIRQTPTTTRRPG